MQGIIQKIDAPPVSGASICCPESLLPRLNTILEIGTLANKNTMLT
jgi:hypothetical protein